MTGLPRLIFMELKLFLREPLAVFFVVAFPALLVGILGSVPGFREPKQDIGGLRVIDLYVPIAIAFVLVMLSLNLVPATLATYPGAGHPAPAGDDAGVSDRAAGGSDAHELAHGSGRSAPGARRRPA